ncbi:MAG: SDR family oxidoreductase [Bryobacteraceae bacterium]
MELQASSKLREFVQASKSRGASDEFLAALLMRRGWVNAVSPGVIDTPFHEVFSTPEMIRNFVTAIPLGRVGTSMEVAKVIAFLASDAASYLVGETIEVNGGQLML